MEGFVVLDAENKVAIGDKPNIQKATKVSFSNPARQKLGDISNLSQQARALTRDDKPQFMSMSTREYFNQFQKENKVLLKIIEEMNILIDMTGVELKKLRINLQKMQQQNLQLAQSNSQMPCARRRSARLKHEEPRSIEELLEIPEAKVYVCLEGDDVEQANGLNSTCSLNNEEKESISEPVQETQDFRRCTLSRPSRQAAKKVQTYKEAPVNIKLRRTE